MTTKKEIVSRLLFENTNLIHTYESDDDVEQYYDSLPEPKKISTTEFVALVNQEVRTEGLKQLRQERNKRLVDADWVTLRAYSSGTDVPEEWMTYMQALRDLPSVTKDPANPVWPEPPNPSLVGEKMEKLIAPRMAFLETSVASLISKYRDLKYNDAETEILEIKVKNIEGRLGMIEESLTSILSKLNI